MRETVVKIVLRQDAKVVKCKELLDFISSNENVKSFRVDMNSTSCPEVISEGNVRLYLM